MVISDYKLKNEVRVYRGNYETDGVIHHKIVRNIDYGPNNLRTDDLKVDGKIFKEKIAD